jgi:hypothetical protein
MLIKQKNKLFDLQPPSGLKFVYVEGKGLGVFADRNFQNGEDIISFINTFVDRDHATSEAVQVTDDTYLDTEWLVTEAFINHSCDPNAKLEVRLDQPSSAYVAIKDIAKDEEITFNYLATEYDMVKNGGDFECACGSPDCYHHIQCFKYLTRDQQEKLKLLLLPYLANKLSK